MLFLHVSPMSYFPRISALGLYYTAIQELCRKVFWQGVLHLFVRGHLARFGASLWLSVAILGASALQTGNFSLSWARPFLVPIWIFLSLSGRSQGQLFRGDDVLTLTWCMDYEHHHLAKASTSSSELFHIYITYF
jgi:hypothetical protein